MVKRKMIQSIEFYQPYKDALDEKIEELGENYFTRLNTYDVDKNEILKCNNKDMLYVSFFLLLKFLIMLPLFYYSVRYFFISIIVWEVLYAFWAWNNLSDMIFYLKLKRCLECDNFEVYDIFLCKCVAFYPGRRSIKKIVRGYYCENNKSRFAALARCYCWTKRNAVRKEHCLFGFLKFSTVSEKPDDLFRRGLLIRFDEYEIIYNDKYIYRKNEEIPKYSMV